MRTMAIVAWFLLIVTAAPLEARQAGDPQILAAFAHAAGLRDVAGFVETVQSLRGAARLPPRYVTKDQAKAHGWHGGGLCSAWPGHAIGGDVFRNFGTALPAEPGRIYREADLDGDCRSRGPKRLIFSNDGYVYVTVDHYNSFVPVP